MWPLIWVLISLCQVQAAVVLSVGVIGWTIAGFTRRKELLRQRSGKLTAEAQRRAKEGRQVRDAAAPCQRSVQHSAPSRARAPNQLFVLLWPLF